MPRNPQNPSEFIAGPLPVIEYNGKKYYVDGRMEQVRNVEDFSDILEPSEEVAQGMSAEAEKIIMFEMYGE